MNMARMTPHGPHLSLKKILILLYRIHIRFEVFDDFFPYISFVLSVYTQAFENIRIFNTYGYLLIITFFSIQIWLSYWRTAVSELLPKQLAWIFMFTKEIVSAHNLEKLDSIKRILTHPNHISLNSLPPDVKRPSLSLQSPPSMAKEPPHLDLASPSTSSEDLDGDSQI